MALIAFEHVTKTFPGVVALDDVSLAIEQGEVHAICGENGAGKSTLMKILSGVITDYQGAVRIRGRLVKFSGTKDAEAAGISIIHQELNLVEQLSVAANIFLGREFHRFGFLQQRRMDEAAKSLLAELECDFDVRQRVAELRVGDQQLIEIAKALSLESDILIMDEPTSALTDAEAERLFRVMERLRTRGVTILYISHKINEIFRLADRISVLRDGRLVATCQKNETSPREITHLMVGRDIEASQFAGRRPGEVLLEVRNLSLPWPGHARRWRLQDISFQLYRGEILGIAGLMGAGRTELLECLFGAAREPFQGQILLRGRPVRFRHPLEARRAGVAMVTEDRKRLGLFSQMNVRENVSIAHLSRVALCGLVRRRREEQTVQSMVERLGVRTPALATAITALSGGNQQKCLIGRWLLTAPDVLLLDDPTRGIDVGAKAELYRLMDELARQGLGIILTSSELPELLTVCDRIVVLAEGKLTAEFSREEATEQRIMEAATLGAA